LLERSKGGISLLYRGLYLGNTSPLGERKNERKGKVREKIKGKLRKGKINKIANKNKRGKGMSVKY
jgi:hypothetical protein